ncbi:hypothetical protein WP5S18E01_15160 [Enterobacter cloacae]|nr:hypothetical protein WP5S18E01_15160 [Enterobacter cloacae]
MLMRKMPGMSGYYIKNHKFLRALMCFEQNFSKSVNYSVKEYYDFW